MTLLKEEAKLDDERIYNLTHFLELSLKIVGCWDWYRKPTRTYQVFVNNIYLSMVLFILANLTISLVVHLYTEWVDVMSSLDKMADGLPLLASVAIVSYFAIYKQELYELVDFMNKNFKWRSARGLTNMTMLQSYRAAKNFAYFYTGCTVFSVAMYVIMPVLAHFWTKQPLQPWIYMDVTRTPFLVLVFLRQCVAQAFVALAVGQLGVFFACNSILLCGQLELVCCSAHNAPQSAQLARGARHAALAARAARALHHDMCRYTYNKAYMVDTVYHYDEKIGELTSNKESHFDIYTGTYDGASLLAIREYSRAFQVAAAYRDKFERFVSPLLALRVVQVTLYLCTLLYAATLKFDMITVEYLGAVALDIFVYCYFGNQIITQAERVGAATYGGALTEGGRRAGGGRCARGALLLALRAARRPFAVRAARFLPMDLHTFVVIIKTSFSYYTLLASVNEKKEGTKSL